MKRRKFEVAAASERTDAEIEELERELAEGTVIDDVPLKRAVARDVKRTRDHNVTGNVGLYWTCYELSRRGWNAMPTSRNARGVDIIAYNRDCSNKVAIQVKTLSKKNPVPLGKSLAGVTGDFWIIVNDVLVKPQAYVLRPSEVRDGAFRGEKDGRVSFWLQPCAYCLEGFRDKWNRLGEP